VLIPAAQRVEHYEIASYGTLRDFAGRLGRDDIQESLQITLDQESRADEVLTNIAQKINEEAAH
jgi:ferritin-like metal-binding protein YciE